MLEDACMMHEAGMIVSWLRHVTRDRARDTACMSYLALDDDGPVIVDRDSHSEKADASKTLLY